MLTRSSVSASYGLAQKLAAQGFALRVLDQTPLSVLVNTSLTQARIAQNAEGLDAVPEFAQSLIDASTAANPLGEVAHDKQLEEAVAMMSQALTFGLDLAKNTVNPIIKKVIEQTQAHMDSKASTALSPLSVVPFNYNPIWDSPILADLVGRYASQPLTDIALRPLGLEAPASYEELAYTGIGRFDEEVATWIRGLDTTYVASTWNMVFGSAVIPTLGPLLAPRYSEFDRALLIYLFARHYTAEVPAGVNMELNEWNAYISTILSQAGRSVVRVFEKRELDRKYKNLVISVPQGEEPAGDIVVVGDVYDQWLREGGTPEVLFGAAYSQSPRGYSELLAAAEAHKNTWKRIYSLLQSKLSFDRFNALVEGLRNSVGAAIAELPDELLVVPRNVLMDRLRERLTHVKQKDLEDLYGVARKAVCRVIFPHTDAEQILLAIDASAKAHPQLDIREAALLATVDIVAAWLAKLVTVEDARDIVG